MAAPDLLKNLRARGSSSALGRWPFNVRIRPANGPERPVTVGPRSATTEVKLRLTRGLRCGPGAGGNRIRDHKDKVSARVKSGSARFALQLAARLGLH